MPPGLSGRKNAAKSTRIFKVISLFAGAGGLDYAFRDTECVTELFSTDSHPIFLQTAAVNVARHFPKVQQSHVVADVNCAHMSQ